MLSVRDRANRKFIGRLFTHPTQLNQDLIMAGIALPNLRELGFKLHYLGILLRLFHFELEMGLTSETLTQRYLLTTPILENH